jgi:hypothetical protein
MAGHVFTNPTVTALSAAAKKQCTFPLEKFSSACNGCENNVAILGNANIFSRTEPFMDFSLLLPFLKSKSHAVIVPS